MRLLATFIALAALILLIWIIWGGAWESHFTLAGATSWLQQAGPWAWSAGIGLLAADLVLPRAGVRCNLSATVRPERLSGHREISIPGRIDAPRPLGDP